MAKKNTKKTWKKGDKAKYQYGLAPKPITGTVVRLLKKGSKMPSIPNLKSTYVVGEEVFRDSAVLELKDGTRRIVPVGYLR